MTSIIISKLSSKKILCKYKVPIVFESGYHIRDIEIKGRYKFNTTLLEMLKPNYYICAVSRILGVKMKNVKFVWYYEQHTINVRLFGVDLPTGFSGDVTKDIKLIKKICIFDKICERDYKIKELCKQV